jgi:hemoglobin/transferrin/lactoferrin receptor protein
MKLLKHTTTILLAASAIPAFAQMPVSDSTKTKNIGLNEVIISANKVEETKKHVAQQVSVIPETEIIRMQAQNTADLIANSSTISVQKSQMGGGSPVLRGFEASRIVLMVDGVRMNNIMYRAGHLQNILSLDNNSFDRIEVLFGPSSTVYGSDALGGVIHMYTKKPRFATDGNFGKHVNAFVRYGSVNNEMTGHADFNLGGKKFAYFTSVTYSSFDDLKGGKNQNFFYDARYGDRLTYVDRINGKDSVLKNADPSKQIQSAYTQYDVVQKFAFRQNEHITHGLNLQFSNSSNIPRYDRLTDPSATTGLRYAEWYYGPQQRLMAAYDITRKDETSFFQTSRAVLSFQDIVESRHQRSFGKNSLAHRIEHANVAGLNIDFQRVVKQHNIRIGLDAQYNTLNSTAREENIATGVEKPLDTRYPGGTNMMHNSAVYGSHTWTINDKFTMVDGLRFGYSELSSTFVDKTFFPLPYDNAGQKTPVYSGSLGIIHNHADDLKISLLASSGFRAPNVDDLAKVFESAKGSIVVPNADLKPEKTVNGELGVTKVFGARTMWENAIYYTRFFDAIVMDKFTFNGADSVMYDGVSSRVLANQNKRKAHIYGVSSSVTSQLTDNFSLSAALAYTYGRIETDSVAYPLDHIPPFMARLAVSYTQKKLDAQVFFIYNAAKDIKDYYRNGEDNEQYATKDGMPAWLTANFRVSYKVHKLITLQAGVDNILDTQYRVFASGINAPGRNVFGTIRFHY